MLEIQLKDMEFKDYGKEIQLKCIGAFLKVESNMEVMISFYIISKLTKILNFKKRSNGLLVVQWQDV